VVLVVTLTFRSAATVAADAPHATALPCQSKQLTTDYQIDQCLTSNIHAMTQRMESSLRKESRFLHYASRSQDWRVARRTQATFVTFAREECLAQANPYQPGTIVTILYGECVLKLYDQRLAYIDQTITAFQNGGEVGSSS